MAKWLPGLLDLGARLLPLQNSVSHHHHLPCSLCKFIIPRVPMPACPCVTKWLQYKIVTIFIGQMCVFVWPRRLDRYFRTEAPLAQQTAGSLPTEHVSTAPESTARKYTNCAVHWSCLQFIWHYFPHITLYKIFSGVWTYGRSRSTDFTLIYRLVVLTSLHAR